MARIFASEKQKRKVFAILKRQGFGRLLPPKPKIDWTDRYARIRVRDPDKFIGLRTKEIGRTGFTKLITGRPKGKKTTEVQSILISRKDYGV